jgi:transcriptional regulator GlxA family with amidase domain
MSFHADIGIDELQEVPAMMLLPGGFGCLELALNPEILDVLRRLSVPPAVLLAVSTGSLPLAAAGLLADQRVSGHWLSRIHLRRFGAIPVNDQFVRSGRIITATGSVSAGLAARFAADLVAFGPQGVERRRSVDLGKRA